jgi:class 3 adenylate cyclase
MLPRKLACVVGGPQSEHGLRHEKERQHEADQKLGHGVDVERRKTPLRDVATDLVCKVRPGCAQQLPAGDCDQRHHRFGLDGQKPVQQRVVPEVVERNRETFCEPVVGGFEPADGVVELGEEEPGLALHHRLHQGITRSELAVDRDARYTGTPGDILDRQTPHAKGLELSSGCVQNPLRGGLGPVVLIHRYKQCNIDPMTPESKESRRIPALGRGLAAVLQRDPKLAPKIARTLTRRVDDESLSLMVQAARAIEPVLERAAESKPSRLARLGLKGTAALGRLGQDGVHGRLRDIARSKSIGIVFIDVVDFTSYTAAHGDDAGIRLLDRASGIVDRGVEIGKGVSVKKLGDGWLLAFPSPSQAVRASVHIARAARRAGLGLRIAVHAGSPRVDEDDLLGHDVNIAARLLEHCGPGEVVVTDDAKVRAERRLRTVRWETSRRVDVRGARSAILVHSPA